MTWVVGNVSKGYNCHFTWPEMQKEIRKQVNGKTSILIIYPGKVISLKKIQIIEGI